MNYVAFVIPAFFIFAGLEYVAARRRNKNIFTYESSVANISIGVAERLLNLLITGSFYSLFYYVYENFGIFNIPNHWSIWIILLLATDLVWYWYHRLGHEINVMWGAHIVHHQSDEFNYTVSARITTIQAVIRNLFWCILPLAGFHPTMVITILVVHGTYSFFTHTQIIHKLGWLEHILITPSHHRVHHASNEKYLNKNYGDIFVFWDKLFGTFQKEEETPVYGLTHPLKSKSFLWQHFHYYAELWEACRRSASFTKAIRILFGKPEDLDQSIRQDLEARLKTVNTNKVVRTKAFRGYVNGQLIFCLVSLFVFTLYFRETDIVLKTVVIVGILLTLINCGALLEQQRWIFYLEIIRMTLVCGYISFIQNNIALFVFSVITLALICSSNRVEKWYYNLIYS